MTITLEFDGETERAEAEDALLVHQYKVALYTIQEKIRYMDKYSEYKHEETATVIGNLREYINQTIGYTPIGNE
jgi:aspartate-semialdehyde dehydrogenase